MDLKSGLPWLYKRIMNFLSHYFLHRDKNDPYFTVGLTMPDLLGFHTKRVRLTKKFCVDSYHRLEDDALKSHLSGIMMHFLIDRYFHGCEFFKEKVVLLQNVYKDYNDERELLPYFHAHILLEILIDRFILKIIPGIADRFYDTYQRFNFYAVSKLFLDLENFDQHNFLYLAYNVANSTFLKQYIFDNKVVAILNRISKRLALDFKETNNDTFSIYVGNVYAMLEHDIEDLLDSMKNNSYFDRINFERNNFYYGND